MSTPLAMQSPSAGSISGIWIPQPGTLIGRPGSYCENGDSRWLPPPMLANAPLEYIRDALDAVMYGGARIPLFAEHHLAAASTERLREHAEMLLHVIGPHYIGSAVPSTGADILQWILHVQRTHLEPHRPKLSSVRVSPPMACISPVVTPVASAVATPSNSFVPPVLRVTPPATPVVSFVPPLSPQSLPTTLPMTPMTPPRLPMQTSNIPDELEFVMVGGVEVPFFLESQLRALHPLRLRSHAMALQRTLILPLPPASEDELVQWVLETQRRHLDVFRQPPASVAAYTASQGLMAAGAAAAPVSAQAVPLQSLAPSNDPRSPPAALLSGTSSVGTLAPRMQSGLLSAPASPSRARPMSTASSVETVPMGQLAAPRLTQPAVASYLQSLQSPKTAGPKRSATPPPVRGNTPPVSDVRIAGRLTPPSSWTPAPGPPLQSAMWNAAGPCLDTKMDVNGTTPSLGMLAPNTVWNAGSALSDTKVDLNSTGFGLGSGGRYEAYTAPTAADRMSPGGSGVGNMPTYPTYNQGGASLVSNVTLGDVQQVVFYGMPLAFYSDQQLQAMSMQQLREQANLLFQTIGAERIGTIIPPLDNDLLIWVRWVQMVHLDPLRVPAGAS